MSKTRCACGQSTAQYSEKRAYAWAGPLPGRDSNRLALLRRHGEGWRVGGLSLTLRHGGGRLSRGFGCIGGDRGRRAVILADGRKLECADLRRGWIGRRTDIQIHTNIRIVEEIRVSRR